MVEFVEYVKGLDSLKIRIVRTYYSAGTRERAFKLASIAEEGYAFLKSCFKADADLALLVLDAKDWRNRTTELYGAPFQSTGAIHLSAETETPAIEALSAIFDSCPQNLKDVLGSLSGNEDEPFDNALQTWFDYIVVHELTHGFVEKQRIGFGVSWLNELFADYATYAFLRRYESNFKKNLRVFETVSKILYQGGRVLAKHTTLDDFDALYTYLSWPNYIWYHGKFFVAVFELYGKYGEAFIQHMVDTFRLTNDSLVKKIGQFCRGFEQWFRTWEKED